MKIVFMGTPDFSVGALKALIVAGHDITAVVTQPDKAKGRSGKPSYSPVKEYALAANIPVLQPIRIREAAAVEELREFEADVFVVAAFGQILTKEILDMPRLGSLNIHASLLPQYRGASPIQWAVINGDEKTGITIQQMNEGVDTGDILYQKEIIIDKKETGESLFDKLSVLGAEAIVEALSLLEAGKLVPVPQREEDATHTVRLKKSMGKIDWTKSAAEIERLIRGLNSWPSAYTFFEGKQLKIWEAEVDKSSGMVSEKDKGDKPNPGTVLAIEKDRFAILCGTGILWITSLQLEGKKRMNTHDFLLGNKISAGMMF